MSTRGLWGFVVDRHPPLPELSPGDVVGCYRVLRESYPLNGDRYYAVRCIGCSREKRVNRYVLFQAQNQGRCTHCPRTEARP